MRVLIEPYDTDIDIDMLFVKPTGCIKAGVLHVKQEFFRPFFDEIDSRISILGEVFNLFKTMRMKSTL